MSDNAGYSPWVPTELIWSSLSQLHERAAINHTLDAGLFACAMIDGSIVHEVLRANPLAAPFVGQLNLSQFAVFAVFAVVAVFGVFGEYGVALLQFQVANTSRQYL